MTQTLIEAASIVFAGIDWLGLSLWEMLMVATAAASIALAVANLCLQFAKGGSES